MKEISPRDYGCQILLEKTTPEKANDSSFPSDSYLIWYIENGTKHMDLTRCNKMVNLFDFYYDKYGKNAIQKIDFGNGKIRPNNWGIQTQEKKKSRR